MWTTLSQQALLDHNLRVAQRCFAALGDMSKSRYLHKVNQLAQQYAQELGGDGHRHFAVQARMAILNKQFPRAEAILLDQNQTEECMEMYQELHKWEEAIRVAEKMNHPDVKEHKANFYQWLLETHQEEKAAELKERQGDYQTAVALYLKGGLPARAAALIQTTPQQYSQELLERVATALTNANMHDKAGDLFEKMDMLQRALDAYIRGQAYRKAVDLARRSFPSQVVSLEEQWGDWLVSQRQVDAALHHYIEAGVFQKAIEAAINARQWSRALQLLDKQEAHIARPYYRLIAGHYRDMRQFEDAERFFLRAGAAREAVEMYSQAGRWDAAHRVAINNMPEAEVAKLYIEQAQRLEAQGKLKEAEKKYLQVNEPDLAINMYKKVKQYENMVRLVGQFRKDLLKQTHLHLAQQLELEGNLKQAEHHYGEAGEWQASVNMYRGQDMWEEALRVAKFHGGPAAHKRVANLWAQSLGGDAGSKLLIRLGLIDQAVDYALELFQFDQALKLAQANCKSKLPEVHLKYALHLEDEQRFKEAEEEFIKAEKPKEAIDMYVHQQDWVSAMRVAENYEPAAVSEVLVAQARVAVERKDFSKAEQLYINAKKPELAVNMYKDAGLFQEAIRLAKKHAQNKLPELNAAYARQHAGNSDGSLDDLLSSAKVWEETRDWPRAIDTYLSVGEQHSRDVGVLEEAWETAIKIAMEHDKGRYAEVVAIVAKRLQQLRRLEQAGELYESIERFKEAVECYVHAQSWERAKDLASQAAPHLLELVQRSYRAHLIDNRQADTLVEHGDVASGLDLYVQRGEWDKCLEVAEQQGSEVLAKYLTLYCTRLAQEENFEECVRVLSRYGAPPLVANLPMYKAIAVQVLHGGDEGAILDLKQVLSRLLNNLRSADRNVQAEFDKLVWVSHLLSLRTNVHQAGIKELVARLSVSLLRYVAYLPADKAFYEAGMACKEIKQLNMAFVFTNRYVDLAEVIEDPDAQNNIDNADFENTDIPSVYHIDIPERQYLPDDKREQVRNWVLDLSMDQRIEQTLPTRACEKCKKQVYEGNITCPYCQLQSEVCCASGYPVLKSSRTQCKSCDKPANKDSWNLFVQQFKTCPWCDAAASPAY
eukprot:GILI01003961.1.p1 GENE.GILI01003961.1~~GILI01003961.1.p1  ORF type:complete len:1242 (-),score=439.08 GILI01003961.1:257-3580(-)